MRRTKIIATLGPSSKNPEQLVSLINAGMDVARFNFSHADHAFYREFFVLLRQVADEMKRPISILQDLQGPKIRTGALKDGQPIDLIAGQELRITTEETVGTAQEISTTYTMLPHDVQVGDRILLSDGTIELRVKNVVSDIVVTDVVHGGSLRENQGINLPGVRTSIPAVTEKDIEDLKFGLEQGVDYVAVSFVRQASDLSAVKKLIEASGKDTPVIAKLEKPEALENLHAILQVADAVMVARGDLGVEMPLEQVPMAQKHIIHTANHAGVPVITATQMLDSMIHNPRPTRAEASDVANAILDGTDVVMLSGETASGSFPVEAVRTMAHIAEAVEGQRESHAREHQLRIVPEIQTVSSQANAIGSAAYALVESLPVRAIATFTQTGRTARIMAQQRPGVPILALTPNTSVYHRLNLLWGVTPFLTDIVHDIETLETHVQKVVKDHALAEAGDHVVISGGHPTTAFGETNFLKIIEIQ